MASLTLTHCPCGCGHEMPIDSYMALALSRHWPCSHADAKDTCAPGVRYCPDCWHWIGTRAAFDTLPAPEPNAHRWIFVKGDE